MSQLFFVVGFSGSGKTSLYRKLKSEYSEKVYFPKTYTTRSPRSEEENSHEYIFVSKENFVKIRQNASQWDEDKIHGILYGMDIKNVHDVLNDSELVVIMNIYPNIDILRKMLVLFDVYEPNLLYILSNQEDRLHRIMIRSKDDANRISCEHESVITDLVEIYGGHVIYNAGSIESAYNAYRDYVLG